MGASLNGVSRPCAQRLHGEEIVLAVVFVPVIDLIDREDLHERPRGGPAKEQRRQPEQGVQLVLVRAEFGPGHSRPHAVVDGLAQIPLGSRRRQTADRYSPRRADAPLRMLAWVGLLMSFHSIIPPTSFRKGIPDC